MLRTQTVTVSVLCLVINLFMSTLRMLSFYAPYEMVLTKNKAYGFDTVNIYNTGWSLCAISTVKLKIGLR